MKKQNEYEELIAEEINRIENSDFGDRWIPTQEQIVNLFIQLTDDKLLQLSCDVGLSKSLNRRSKK